MAQQNQEVKNGNVRKTPIFIALGIALAVIILAGITSFLRSERQQGSDFTFQFESGQQGQRMVQYLASQPTPPAAVQAPSFNILPALLKTTETHDTSLSSDLSFPQSYQQYLNTLAAAQESTEPETKSITPPQLSAEAQLAQTLQKQRISQLMQALSASAGVDQPYTNPHKALRTSAANGYAQGLASNQGTAGYQSTVGYAQATAYMDYPDAKAQLAVLEQMDRTYQAPYLASYNKAYATNALGDSTAYPQRVAYAQPSYANGSGVYAHGAGSYANASSTYANGSGAYTNVSGTYTNGFGMNSSAMLPSAALQFNSGISSTQTLQAYQGLNQQHRTLQTALEPVLSPFLLRQGAVLPCVLLTGINSDLPGMIQAQLAQDVFDSPQGEHLLIPKGSKIIGQYAASPKLGQQRLMLAFNRIIFPDGTAMGLGAMPGSGLDGYAGFDAEVDNHFWQLMSNAILLGGITAGISISVDEPRDDNGDLTLNGALSQGLGQSMGRVLTQVIERNMAISPTLKVQPGLEFNVTLTQDIYFDHPYGI